MKTYTELEPKDIDTNNKLHMFLIAQVLIIGLTGFKPMIEDGPNPDPMVPIKRIVAGILNAAQRQEITIAHAESIPDAFLKGFDI